MGYGGRSAMGVPAVRRIEFIWGWLLSFLRFLSTSFGLRFWLGFDDMRLLLRCLRYSLRFSLRF